MDHPRLGRPLGTNGLVLAEHDHASFQIYVIPGQVGHFARPGARIPEEVVWGSLEHDVLEYANFRAVVPDIYAEFGHAIP